MSEQPAVDTASSAPLIEVENLAIDFRLPEGRIAAVKQANFDVMPGETVALVGESGSGKSVMAQAILGILPKSANITSGRILFRDPAAGIGAAPLDIAGLDRDSKAMRAIRGGRISIIFQEPMTSLSPVHTVGNQVIEALMLHREVSTAEAEELSRDMLRLVGFPDPARALRTYPFELSGGLRQRAMIAMALVCRPALLIADEPTTALDVTIQALILKLIADLKDELGMAVLMITHDLGVVANVAQRVVVMFRGEIVERGPLESIYAHPQHPYLGALLKAVPRFGMEPGERLVPLREIEHDGHEAFESARQPWPEEATGPLLKVEGISKSFTIRKAGWFAASKAAASVLAVDDVSLEIARGECLGLVGESGCGKTTLSKIIMRALTPDAGKISYNDRGKTQDLLALEGDELLAFRRKVQFVFQDPYSSLNPRMPVSELISEPLTIHGESDRAKRLDWVKDLMRMVGLDVRALGRYPHSFSGGQRQRIGIARALALKPELLILDEPVSALDVSIQAQILNLLLDLKEELGLTYLFISHNLAVVDYVADRIAVMCRGRLVEVAPSAELFKAPRHPYTQALLAAVPEPDPAARLDLDALMDGRASEPTAWPEPFTLDGRGHPRLVDLGGGHFVRADPDRGSLASAA